MSNLLEYFNGDELAANVWKSKYAVGDEQSPEEMHRRMAKEFARADKKYQAEENKKYQDDSLFSNLSLYGKKRSHLSEKDIFNFFKGFKHIIPQGSIMATLGTPVVASLSNCWVAESPIDSYGGILKTDGDLAYYYKRRGGVGTDISNLRPKGTPTNNTSKSSTGAVSFMHRFSNTTREVAMNGRRGALMLSISINHPDVMDFIKIKRDGTSVTGANISIRLTDDFMEAVQRDEDYVLRFPCDLDQSLIDNYSIENYEYNKLEKINRGYIKRIKSKEYWDEIIKSARNYAEPGLMYWDNVLNNDPAAVYPQFKPTSSNPCGEQFLNPNDSCRLMVLNLFSIVNNPFTEKAEIDFDKLYKLSYEFSRLGDDLVDLELEYIQRIIDKIKNDPEPENIKRAELELWEKSYTNTKAGRRVGLGITALGDMLAALGVKYDSNEALEIIDKVMNKKMEAELDCTIDLAILRGTFEGYDYEKEYIDATSSGLDIVGTNDFYHMLITDFNSQFQRMKKYGRRSISWSTIAPTGSVSILTQTTSGCEPIFQPFYMRRKKINPNEEGVRVDFVDEIGDSWQEFPVLHPKFKDWFIIKTQCEHCPEVAIERINQASKDELAKIYEQSPWYKSTANDINWVRRNEIQAVLQRYTTNAISSTINLPSTVTEAEVSEIYMSGWKLGLKGQTVYVDGSRSGVLVTETKKKEDVFEYVDAFKRPKELECDIHSITSRGKKWNVIVGLLNGKPYEVFAASCFTDKQGKGTITKSKSKTYSLTDSHGNLICENISDYMNFDEVFGTRLISTALRHRTDIRFIFDQLDSSYGDITSFSKAIARVLKKYIPEVHKKKGLVCESCGSDNIIFEEGCNKCVDCGSSKCG